MEYAHQARCLYSKIVLKGQGESKRLEIRRLLGFSLESLTAETGGK